jgi:hypothetical protein
MRPGEEGVARRVGRIEDKAEGTADQPGKRAGEGGAEADEDKARAIRHSFRINPELLIRGICHR